MFRNVPWSRADDFHVFISNPVLPQNNALSSDIFEMAIESISLPSFTSAEQDIVMGGERRVGVKIFESFRFSITFRDFTGLSIYRWLQSIWVTQQYEYPENIKTHVKVETDGIVIFETNDAFITSLSEVSLGHASNNVTSFTAQFICNRFSSKNIKDFGSQDYMDYFKQGG
jgi:hypothetical protein